MTTDNELFESYAAQRPKATQYFERASKSMGGKVGHDLRHFSPVPLYIESGQGGRKWDVDGHQYIDFLMGNGALLMGHAPAIVIDAIARVMGNGTHFGNDHPLHIEWAEWVQKLVPCAERVRFVNSGTEATLLALRLASAFSGRHRILRFEGHFHGWHDSVIRGFQPPFDAEGSLGVPPDAKDHAVSIPDGDLDLVAETLEREKDIGAVILEPSGASWGRVGLEPTFLQGLRDLTEKKNVVLIFDEVVTGFRFSPGGAQGLHGITPDLCSLAKVLTGGTPGGAVAGRADIMALMDMSGDHQHDRFQRVWHLGTFNAAPICAAAGIAVLEQVATGQPIERANALAAKLRTDWEDILERHGIAGYVYGPCSTFHVYFETNSERVNGASTRQDLYTKDAKRLKGMPGDLVNEYQRHLRFYGVDNMSSTGGVLSSAHTEEDLSIANDVFEKTVVALRDLGFVLSMS